MIGIGRILALVLVVFALAPDVALAQGLMRWAGGRGYGRVYNENGQACASTRQRFEQASALILRGASRYRRDTRRGAIQGAADALWNDSWQAACRREEEQYARVGNGSQQGAIRQPLLFAAKNLKCEVYVEDRRVADLYPGQSVAYFAAELNYRVVAWKQVNTPDGHTYVPVEVQIKDLNGVDSVIVEKAR